MIDAYVAPSPIHGLGLFAAQPIKVGEIWWSFDPSLDQQKSIQEVERLEPRAKRFWQEYGYQKQDGQLVLCFDHARFVNHSNKPNSTDDDYGNSVAISPIDIGDELTEDYRSWGETLSWQ